jgi:biopolymer transport protein ExbD
VIGARSFIDLLFILLLGMLVMLTRSVEIGAVRTDLLRVGGGAVAPVRASDVQLVTIGAVAVTLDGLETGDARELLDRLRADDPVLLVAAEADIPFRRVMDVWSTLRDGGHDVRLGAEPASREKDKE